MKKITLTKLHLINFKGARDLEIKFNPDVTNIYADNGLGKSTISAAFSWLFTGKDQFDSADINKIKTWDKNKKHIEKIDHSVEADLIVGDTPVTLKRVLKQNWVKRRGETETVLDGHKTEYYINGVGCGTEMAFKAELNNIVDERTFKLLTNPLYFNEILEWKDRREILFSIVPPLTDDQVLEQMATLQNKDRIMFLTNLLNSKTDFERYKRELAARKKQKNEQLTLIPAKIDATERTKPEEPDGGFKVLEHQLNKLATELKDIDAAISDKSKINELHLSKIRQKQEVVHKLKSALQDARQKAQAKRQEERFVIVNSKTELENKIKAERRKIESLQSEIDANTKDIKNLKERMAFAEKRGPELEQKKKELLERFYEIDASHFEFDAENCKCSACQRAFKGKDLEEKRAHYEALFNTDKSKKLDQIDATGLQIKKDIEKYETNIEEFTSQIAELEEKNLFIAEEQAKIEDTILALQDKLTTFTLDLQNFDAAIRPASEEESNLSKQIADAEKANQEEHDAPEETTAGPDPLLREKAAKQEEIDKLKTILANKAQIEKANRLIAEYKEDERKLAQEVADMERDEDIMQEFSRTRIESIEKPINSLFQLVTFKLFDVKLNGEEKECCEAIEPNGTPVNDTNTAMKVNCGLDIINVLSNHFGISLPIFIDNKESVSELIPTQAQIINLEKVKGQTSLKIE